MTEISPEPATPREKNVFVAVKDVLLNGLGLTAVVALIGFIVINSYLATFTKMFSYNINFTQYLAAGVNLILFILLNVGRVLWEVRDAVLIGVVVGGLLLIIDKPLVPKLRQRWNTFISTRPFWRTLSRLKPFFTALVKLASNNISWVMLLLLSLLGGITGYVFGPQFYAITPRSIGGGIPVEVYLIFKEGIQPAEWPFAVSVPASATPSKRSEKVLLLLELTDGVLVKDIGSNAIIEVKNDALNGIIEYSPTISSATLAPASTATPPVTLPGVTATPTP